MEEKLDPFLDPVLSFRRSAIGPAKQMASLNAQEQQFGLHWVEIIAATNAEMAYQFSANFAQAVLSLQHDLEAVQLWIVDAMTAFDEKGLQLSIKVLLNSKDFAQNHFSKQLGITLVEVKKLLSTFVCGLNGRVLNIESATQIYTDTETIFLPELIADYASKEENFLYYKLLTVFHWAQNWFGTWRYDLNEKFNEYDDPVQALQLFHSIETIRLLACIRITLPGFYRQAQPFLDDYISLKEQGEWSIIVERLSQNKVEIEESLKILDEYYGKLSAATFSFQGVLLPNKVQQLKNKRIVLEKNLFREALASIANEKPQSNSAEESL